MNAEVFHVLKCLIHQENHLRKILVFCPNNQFSIPVNMASMINNLTLLEYIFYEERVQIYHDGAQGTDAPYPPTSSLYVRDGQRTARPALPVAGG